MSVNIHISTHDRAIKAGGLVGGDKFVAFEGPSTPGLKFGGRVTRLQGRGAAGRVWFTTAVKHFGMEADFDQVVFVGLREFDRLQAEEAAARVEMLQGGISNDSAGWATIATTIVARQRAAGREDTNVFAVNVA